MGKKPGSDCEKPGCLGKRVRRSDDEPAAIRNRLEVYDRQTAPVLEWYRRTGIPVHRIDAVGDVTEVTSRALGALKKSIPNSLMRRGRKRIRSFRMLGIASGLALRNSGAAECPARTPG